YGGTQFADDRGSISFATSYSETTPLPWSKRRGYGPGLLIFRANPENTGPDDGIFDFTHHSNGRLNHIAYGGSFVFDDVYYTFDPNLRPMVHDAEPWGPTDDNAIGGDGWRWTDF